MSETIQPRDEGEPTTSPIEQPPFRYKLHEISDVKLQEFYEDSEKIVKVLTHKQLSTNMLNLDPQQSEHTALLNASIEDKKLLEELRQDYGIEVVHHNLVVGKDDEGKAVLYTVADRVHGKNLYEELKDPNTKLDDAQITQLYTNLFHYYRDKFLSGTDFKVDLVFPEQFMYGHTEDAHQDKLYLVDVDPYFARGTASTGYTKEDFQIGLIISNLIESMQEIERLRDTRPFGLLKREIKTFLDEQNVSLDTAA